MTRRIPIVLLPLLLAMLAILAQAQPSSPSAAPPALSPPAPLAPVAEFTPRRVLLLAVSMPDGSFNRDWTEPRVGTDVADLVTIHAEQLWRVRDKGVTDVMIWGLYGPRAELPGEWSPVYPSDAPRLVGSGLDTQASELLRYIAGLGMTPHVYVGATNKALLVERGSPVASVPPAGKLSTTRFADPVYRYQWGNAAKLSAERLAPLTPRREGIGLDASALIAEEQPTNFTFAIEHGRPDLNLYFVEGPIPWRDKAGLAINPELLRRWHSSLVEIGVVDVGTYKTTMPDGSVRVSEKDVTAARDWKTFTDPQRLAWLAVNVPQSRRAVMVNGSGATAAQRRQVLDAASAYGWTVIASEEFWLAP
jgi:hypothetical protein